MKAIFHLLLALAALASTRAHEITDSGDTVSLELVSGKSGELHSVLALNEGGGSHLIHEWFDGKLWHRDSIFSNPAISDHYHGVDLAVSPNGSLHGSCFVGNSVAYFTKHPGSPVWTSGFVFTAPGNSSEFTRTRSSTSIALRNGHPIITFNHRPGDVDYLIYLAELIEGSWKVAPVPLSGSNSDLTGFHPVISPFPAPTKFPLPGTPGPTIAYWSEGEFRFTVRSTTSFMGIPLVTWSNPVTMFTGISSFGSPEFRKGHLEIRDGVFHFLALAKKSPADPLESLYHRREIKFGPLSISSESVAGSVLGSNDSTKLMSLSVDPAGNPRAAVQINGTNGDWKFVKCRRLGPDNWVAEDVQAELVTRPKLNAITIDPLGRAAIMASLDGEANDPNNTLVFQEKGTRLTRSGFPVNSLFPSANANGLSAIDGKGGIGFVYSISGESLLYRYQNPVSQKVTHLDLTPSFGNEGPNIRIGQFKIARAGSEKIIVAGRFDVGLNLQDWIFVLQGKRLIRSHQIQGPAGKLPLLTLTGDAHRYYYGALGGASEVRVYSLDGSRDTSFESEILSHLGPGYTKAQFSANNGGFAILAQQNDSLQATFRNHLGQWRSYSVDLEGDLISMDLTVEKSSFHIAYSTDSFTFVAESRTAISNIFQPVFVAGPTSVSISRDFQGRTHLANLVPSTGETYHTIHDGFPTELSGNQISDELVFENTSNLVVAWDTLGYPVFIANANGPRQLARSPLTEDRDGDGLPFFLEQAFCRDPLVAETTPVSTVNQAAPLVAEFTFDRVAGFAQARDGAIEVGSFRYLPEFSNSLRNFSTSNILVIRNPDNHAGSLPPGEAIPGGGERQTLQFTSRNAQIQPFTKVFFQVRVELR